MCDDFPTIMAVVKKVKEVEERLGREIDREDCYSILESLNEQIPFQIDGQVFDPPTVMRGLKAHQGEVSYAHD